MQHDLFTPAGPDPLVNEALTLLNRMPREVSDWKAAFLNNLLQQSYPLRPKQRAVLVRMLEQYIPESPLAAELRGQARLFE
jgi:hypothetical protein